MSLHFHKKNVLLARWLESFLKKDVKNRCLHLTQTKRILMIYHNKNLGSGNESKNKNSILALRLISLKEIRLTLMTTIKILRKNLKLPLTWDIVEKCKLNNSVGALLSICVSTFLRKTIPLRLGTLIQFQVHYCQPRRESL